LFFNAATDDSFLVTILDFLAKPYEFIKALKREFRPVAGPLQYGEATSGIPQSGEETY
jgi:hypothetical protein